MKKAFEMNGFALENKFSALNHGTPNGFLAIETKLEAGEEAVFTWISDGLRDGSKKTVFEGMTAVAVTLGRLVVAGKKSGSYVTYTWPSWLISHIEISRGIFRQELVLRVGKEKLRFSCGKAASRISDALADVLSRQR